MFTRVGKDGKKHNSRSSNTENGEKDTEKMRMRK